jgi:hypothetical protein
MASNQKQAETAGPGGVDEFGVAESNINKKYAYLATVLLILTAIVLVFLRFMLYLW